MQYLPWLSGPGDGPAGVVEDGGGHPVVRDVLVGAADQVDVVLTRPGRGQERVAAPDGPGDHLGAAVAQLTGHLREEAVVANHHADLAELRVEDGVLVPRRDPGLDLAVRQAHFAILAKTR